MMERRVAFHHALKIAAAAPLGQDMQADRRPEVVRHGPEWIVRRVAVGTFGRRRTPDHRAAQALVRRAPELLDSFERIIERDHRDSRQPPRAMRTIVGEPIVVRAKARRAQVTVFHLKQTHPEARIQHLARDTVALLILDSQLGIPPAWPDARVTARHLFGKVFWIDTGDGEACDREGAESFGDEEVAFAVADVLYDARRTVEKAPVDSRGPDIGGLDHMRIGG